MARKTQKRSYGGVYRMPRKTKKKQPRPIGYELPRKTVGFEYAKRMPTRNGTQQLLNIAMKPTSKKSGKSIRRINLVHGAPARKGSVYEYIKSVKSILRQILHDAKRADSAESETYDLLVLMAVEIANTLPSLKRDLGLESDDDYDYKLNANTNSNANTNANNAEDIFEKVEEVYDIVKEQLHDYTVSLRNGNMDTIETTEAKLMNIAVTLDGAIQEAKNQLVSVVTEEPEESDLDDLLSMMSSLKPFSAAGVSSAS